MGFPAIDENTAYWFVTGSVIRVGKKIFDFIVFDY